MKSVAFLDVLGFKALVSEHSAEEIGKKYEGLLKQANDYLTMITLKANGLHPLTDNKAFLPEIYVLSDSIIITAKDDSPDSSFTFLVLVWRVLQASIISGLPLRGHIEHGDLYTNPAKHIAVGKALVRAVDSEKKAEWIGITIGESFEAQILKMSERTQGVDALINSIAPFYDVPLRSEKFSDAATPVTARMRVINWRLNFVIKAGTKAYIDPDKCNESRAKRKHANTLDFARWMRYESNLGLYISWESMPSIFKTMWVADVPPPKDYKHGDEY